ncbi:MAG: tripartite tricarboxylate transporter permease [archaeon]
MEFLAQAFLGFLAGIFSGLFLPGIHQNSLAVLLLPLGVPGILAGISAQYFSSVPLSVFSGVPSEGSETAVLPAHRMFLAGEGSRAILVSAYSLLLTLPVFLATLPATLLLLPGKFPREFVLGILVFFSVLLVFSEKRLPEAFLVFLASGIFGMNFISSDSLFPVFAGFFGGSLLLESILSGGNGADRAKRPERRTPVPIGKLFFPVILGTLAGFFVGTFPALTVSVVVAALAGLFGGVDTEEFLALSVSGGFSAFLFSLPTFFSSGAERNGVISALSQAGLASFGGLAPAILLVAVASSASAFFLKFCISPLSEKLARLPFLNELSLAILLAAVGLLSGFPGISLFAFSAAISLVAARAGVSKRVLVAFLILPTLASYLS